MATIVIKDKVNDVNEFNFVGKIVYRHESPKSLTISFRSVTPDRGKLYTNTMTIVALDENVKEKFYSIPMQSKVRVTGTIRSSKVERDSYGRPIAPVSKAAFERKAANELKAKEEAAEKEGKTLSRWDQIPQRFRSNQYFLATDVEVVDEIIPDKNELIVVGSVDDTFVTQNGNIRFLIRSNANGFARLSFSVFPNDEVDYLSLMRNRTKVRIVGHCSTWSEPTDTGMEYVETFIIDDISKA